MAIDPGQVNLQYSAGGMSFVIPSVGGPGGCGPAGGWYYDDPAAPTTVIACPDTCDQFQAGSGSVEITFGCATVIQ